MADQSGATVMRDYRKGNWTVNETMILIEAKKMDDERRMKRSGESEGRSKPTELRWKWVEDYCWRKGCLRSQNQCNDKWDNLMRDYKKVRDYERRVFAETGDHDGEASSSSSSYWMIDKNERKDKNLPSNMLPQIYEALVEVVERKAAAATATTSSAAAAAHQRVVVASGGVGLGSISNIAYVVDRVEPPLPPLLQQHHQSPISALPPPQPPPPPQQQQPTLAYSQPLPTLDSDTSEYSDSPAKRRRRGGDGGGVGTTTASGSSSIEVGSAISKSASIIAEAIQASEEREERRHRDLLSLHERRLRIEESKTEMNRQDINGLVDAINNLANSILALATNRTQPPPPPPS